MEDIHLIKAAIRESVGRKIGSLPRDILRQKTERIETRLLDFANFLEANIVLLYVNADTEFLTREILKQTLEYRKILILPAFRPDNHEITLMRVSSLAQDLRPGPRGVLEPDPERCKVVPVDCLDIAVIPGVAFDEKGGRIGTGLGYYDRFIPHLPITTRKVSLALEEQIVPQVPMESHDQHMDIIITDKRTVYKI
jgi:5-formyltetrahydrofolate cyclo-ligase